MNASSFLRLITLAAIWGSSFLYMRIGAPVLGPTVLIALRVAFAALFLFAVSLVLRKSLEVREHWKHYLVLGLFNSALPFLLFAYAAKTLSASILSVLNATAPIWGAIISAVWTRTKLSPKSILGLGLGMAGVAVLVGFDKITLQPGALVAVVAGLVASFCYGLASTYAKAAKSVNPLANAHGSMWAATLLIAPAVVFFPPSAPATLGVMASVVALGVLCSGVAYLMYFRLIADLGAASALTVTFLIPVFGILWGGIFLGEHFGWHTLAGSAVVLVGTALVTGFSPSSLMGMRKPPSTSS